MQHVNAWMDGWMDWSGQEQSLCLVLWGDQQEIVKEKKGQKCHQSNIRHLTGSPTGSQTDLHVTVWPLSLIPNAVFVTYLTLPSFVFINP